MQNFLNDPDPLGFSVPKKKIPFDENFKLFLSKLSFRDRLIARILYYRFDLKISVLLLLKAKEKTKLYYRLPESVIKDLETYSNSRSGDLLFINRKKEAVAKIHLIQAFKRASKDFYDIPITPAKIGEWIP